MIDWTALLERVIPPPCSERPFVCDGFPDKSCVIIIGENPATRTDVDWWHYWSEDKGFDYHVFVADYIAKNMKFSNTRLRLNRFRKNGILCVETNAYRNERAGGAGSGVWNYDVLDMLVRNMPRLCAVVAHGKIAHGFASEYRFPKDTKIFLTRHFRMESYKVIDDICQEIKAICQGSKLMPCSGK